MAPRIAGGLAQVSTVRETTAVRTIELATGPVRVAAIAHIRRDPEHLLDKIAAAAPDTLVDVITPLGGCRALNL
jgi:hypothetical protein